MVQEKLEHCDTFCILRPAGGKSRRKNLIHGPDISTEIMNSNVKKPKLQPVISKSLRARKFLSLNEE